MWRPHDDLLLRVTGSDGFRAPSVPELFFGQSDSYPDVAGSLATSTRAISPETRPPGPRRMRSASRTACRTDSRSRVSQIRITVGGNPALQPEESENFSYGLVYQPGWLEGLQVELDRFDIQITGTIGSIGAQNILEQCYSDSAAVLRVRRPDHRRLRGRPAQPLQSNVGVSGQVEGWDMALSMSGIDTSWGRVGLRLGYDQVRQVGKHGCARHALPSRLVTCSAVAATTTPTCVQPHSCPGTTITGRPDGACNTSPRRMALRILHRA